MLVRKKGVEMFGRRPFTRDKTIRVRLDSSTYRAGAAL
jgi:hypothetical protein